MTKYHRWPTVFRQHIFALIAYLNGDDIIRPGLFPKHGVELEQGIFNKLAQNPQRTLGMILSKQKTNHFIFYQEATRYWVKAMVGVPYYSFNGTVGAPPHGRYLYLHNEDTAYITSALLNCSLFYNYFVALGDCFHLSDTLVSAFPVPLTTFSDESLSQLGRALMEDLNAKSERQTMRTKKGDLIRYAEFYGWKSKSLIDEIDERIAHYYGFSWEEVDYILNFDIKFRMGADGGEEAEEVSGKAN